MYRGLNVLNYLVISDKYIKLTKKCIIDLIHLGKSSINALRVLQVKLSDAWI